MNMLRTSFFLPRAGLNLRQVLQHRELLEDLEFHPRGDGTVCLVAKGGATQWPCEWNQGGEQVDFDLQALLQELMDPGQDAPNA